MMYKNALACRRMRKVQIELTWILLLKLFGSLDSGPFLLSLILRCMACGYFVCVHCFKNELLPLLERSCLHMASSTQRAPGGLR